MTLENNEQDNGVVGESSSWVLEPVEKPSSEMVTLEQASGITRFVEGAGASTTEGSVETLATHEGVVTEKHNADAAAIAVAAQKVMDVYHEVAPRSPEAAIPLVHAIESLDAARAVLGKTTLDAPHFEHSPFNPIELGNRLVTEVSHGAIEYRVNEGAVIDAHALLDHGEKLRMDLEQSEAQRGHRALSYVSDLPKGMLESYVHPVHPSLDNIKDFEIALGVRSRQNVDHAKKAFLGLGTVSLSTFAGTFAAGAMGSAALASGLLLASGGFGVLALGSYGAKRLYDTYKERNAIKDFSAATIARRVRTSLFA